MPGLVTASATAVRKDFSDYFTKAAHKGDVIEVTRYDGNDRAYLVGSLILEFLTTCAAMELSGSAERPLPGFDTPLLSEPSPLDLHSEETGGWTAYYRPLDVMAHADSEPEAVALLIARIRDYADLYMEDLQLYLADPDRRSHFPLLFGTLLRKTDEAVMRFLQLPRQATRTAPLIPD